MKTIRFGWCLLAVLCLLFSCAKELGPDPEPEVKYVTLSLGASVDLTIDSTKTYMQGTSVKWKSGDQVTIYMDGFEPIVSNPTSVIEGGGSYAKFTYQVPEGRADEAKAAVKYIYYGNGTVTCGSGNVPASISVPSTQTYAGSECFGEGENFAFGYMGTNSNECQMRNIFGILKVKIKLKDSNSISYVQLVDNGDCYLAGEYALTLSTSGDAPAMSHKSESPSQSRSLIKRVSSSVSDDGYFYFLVPPGTLSDFSLYVYTGAGIFYGGKTIKLSNPIERAQITTLNLTNFQPSTTSANDLTPANSFIVPATSGTYTIPAQYQGNSTTSVGSAAYAEIMWQGQLSGSVEPFISSAVYFTMNNNGYIRFNRTGGEGNALVAVKDIDGKILWSWHLWITSDADIEAINEGKDLVDPTNPSQKVMTIMDRNLGALSANPADGSISHGLAYQFGRKDPYMGSNSPIASGDVAYASFASIYPSTAIFCDNSNDFSIATSIKMPYARAFTDSHEYWTCDQVSWSGDNKSLYDPCPSGWRIVEENNIRTVFLPSNKMEVGELYKPVATQDSRSFILYNNNDNVYFPGAGSSISKIQVTGVGLRAELWCNNICSSDEEKGMSLQISLPTSGSYSAKVSSKETKTTMPVRCQRETTTSSSPAPSLVSSAECEDDQFEVVYID